MGVLDTMLLDHAHQQVDAIVQADADANYAQLAFAAGHFTEYMEGMANDARKRIDATFAELKAESAGGGASGANRGSSPDEAAAINDGDDRPLEE